MLFRPFCALLGALFFLCMAHRTEADMNIARRGKPLSDILTQPGATPAELHAAQELADALQRITGAAFTVREERANAPETAILIGPGPLASRYFPEVNLATFGEEQYTMRVQGKRLLLAGGRPRGTLYAVMRFLQERCGARWWTPWAADYPRKASLTIPDDLNVTGKPAFESRDPYWFLAFDADWAARNGTNGFGTRLDEKRGGKIVYKGFVHTFYPLVPPEVHFQQHPEWFSEKDGKRFTERGQLCTTNPQLRDFIVERVKAWLRETPEASILSVSQNDWYNACQCVHCKALDDAEGSYAGTMLTLANYVAEKIAPEFPHVAIDTLAYQYTRKAPKTVKPRPNVIVRLCSIECNFAAPLEDASNKAFADDIRDWSKLSNRLYIWDYTTNFAHYVAPHPNWFSLGPNVRFFHQHGVRGLFEQGAYQSHGSEMAELRAWVLAQLLWNPYQDDRKLINEFLDGYYGKPAAKFIRQYLTLMHNAAKGFNLTCFTNPNNAPFLKFATLSRAEKLWQQAEEAAKNDSEKLWRVQQGHLPVRYAFLIRWVPLRRESRQANVVWPLAESRKAVAEDWLKVATGPGPAGWSPMTHINEGGVTPQQFVERFANDPQEEALVPLPDRTKNAPAPADIPEAERKNAVDGQEDLARLFNEGEYAEIRGDRQASDGLAVWMPGDHHEWAFQMPLTHLPARARKGKWKVYAVARVEKSAGADANTLAFTAGVYDTGANAGRGGVTVNIGDASETYRSYLIATLETNESQYIWVAPPANSAVKAVWIDRVYLIPAG